MDTAQIFRILGIEETKDENVIKQAYRTKLVKVNPEDDPEGFKELRTAYEEACALARRKSREELEDSEEGGEEDSKEDGEEDGPSVRRWMRRVKKLYGCFSKRIEAENWKMLLTEDVCSDLDTWLEAREALLAFVMDHFRMPAEVFHTMDRYLSLVKDKEELYEKFPKEFVDFLVDQCTGESWLDYRLFEGPDDADYDGFVRAYFELKDQVDEKKLEGINRRLQDFEAFGIYHPYVDLERARFYDLQERYEEAGELFAALADKYPGDNWVKFCRAEHIWNQGNQKEAARLYGEILEEEPAHYTARIRMAAYALKEGSYEEAKKRYISLLQDVNNYPDFLKGLKEANEHLIEQYKKEWEETFQDIPKAFSLGWCYLENERFDECIGLMESFSPDEEHVCEYHSLRARAYFNAKQYEKAAVHFKEWLEAIRREEPKTKEEREAIPLRLAAALSFLGSTYQKMGGKDPQNYKTALDYVEEAYKEESSIRYLHQKASLLLEMRRYQDCVDVCDKILEEESQYFPAVVIRQEAYYNLRAGQEVIDDFYRALEIYKFYPKMYELAARVFFIYHQYDDAMNILKRADEAQMTSHELAYLKGETLWRLAKDDEERQKALKYLYQLETEWGKDPVEPAELAKLICEETLCLMVMRDYEEALIQINRAIAKDTASSYYLYTKADILFRMRRYKEALKLFLVCESHNTSDDDVLEHIADCYKNLGDTKKALRYYKKALEANPNNPRCNSKIVDLYGDLMDDQEKEVYFEEALPYANRQLELAPEAYYYIERGLLFMDVNRWEDAIADFQKAAQLEPDNAYAYNNLGCVYKYQEKYTLAIEALKKAIEVMEGAQTPLPYSNLGNCYERMGRYEDAVEAYKKDLELFPNKISLYDDLAGAYARLRRYEDAVEALKRGKEVEGANRPFFSRTIALMYQSKGDIKSALEFAQLSVKESETYGKGYRMLGDIYLMDKEQPRTALKYYKKALQCYEEDDGDYRDTCLDIMECYWDLGKRKEVQEYFNKIMDSLKKSYESLEVYLSSYRYQPARLYFLGRLYCLWGDIKRAEDYFDRMPRCEKCRSCTYACCSEYIIGMALVADAKGDKEQAEKWYKQALEIDEAGAFIRYRLAKLKAKRPFWR